MRFTEKNRTGRIEMAGELSVIVDLILGNELTLMMMMIKVLNIEFYGDSNNYLFFS